MTLQETQEQFEHRYGASVFTKGYMVAMRCTCDDGGGPTHWAAIYNSPEAIEVHLDSEEC